MSKRKIKPRTEPHVYKMFEDRMLREKRWEEYEAAVKAEKESLPRAESKTEALKRSRLVYDAARKKCGFISNDHERALYRAYIDDTNRIKPAKEAGAIAQTFEQAAKTLPDMVDEQIENRWVKAHPAMARKERQEDKSKRVIITGNDLLNAPHGKCPSMSAANKLQNWANSPEDVYKALTAPMKKVEGREAEKDTEVVIDDGIDELERAYKTLTNG